MPDDEVDFFISYVKADRAWAQWIAWTLENSGGYTTIIQAWDMARPGGNFVLKMHDAAIRASRTVAVLSPDYLVSAYAAAEWAAAFAKDPAGVNGALVPVMVRPCQPNGLLTAVGQIRIVGLDEVAARDKLLADTRVRARRLPDRQPQMPAPATAPDGPEPAAPRFPVNATAADRQRSPEPALFAEPKGSQTHAASALPWVPLSDALAVRRGPCRANGRSSVEVHVVPVSPITPLTPQALGPSHASLADLVRRHGVFSAGPVSSHCAPEHTTLVRGLLADRASHGIRIYIDGQRTAWSACEPLPSGEPNSVQSTLQAILLPLLRTLLELPVARPARAAFAVGLSGGELPGDGSVFLPPRDSIRWQAAVADPQRLAADVAGLVVALLVARMSATNPSRRTVSDAVNT